MQTKLYKKKIEINVTDDIQLIYRDGLTPPFELRRGKNVLFFIEAELIALKYDIEDLIQHVNKQDY